MSCFGDDFTIHLNGSGSLPVGEIATFTNIHSFFDYTLLNLKSNGVYVPGFNRTCNMNILLTLVDEYGNNIPCLPKGGMIELFLLSRNVANDHMDQETCIYKNYITEIYPSCQPIFCDATFGPCNVVYGTLKYTNEHHCHPINVILKVIVNGKTLFYTQPLVVN